MLLQLDLPPLLHEAPKDLVVIGNLSPVSFIMASPDAITQKTQKLLDTIKNRSSFIIAPGCDLPPETPLINIVSLVRAVKTIN